MDLSMGVKAIIPSLEGDVYRVLARTTTPLSGLRVAELAGTASAPGIRNALARLLRQGTVLATRAGSSTMYVANRDHILWPAIEQAMAAAEHPVAALAERMVRLARTHDEPGREVPATIAIYGSVARGTTGPDSDVDVVAVFPTPGITAADQELVDEMQARVPLWTGNDCNVYAISAEGLAELVDRGDPIVDSWLTESMTVSGPDLGDLIRKLTGRRDRSTRA